MNKKRKIKAHDLLSNEKFTTDSLSDKPENDEQTGDKEIRIARIIHAFLTSRRKTSWNTEKVETKKRIKLSIQRINRNKYITRWAVAASILLVVFSVWFIQNNLKNETEIVDFVQTTDTERPDSVTNLILQDGRKVLIAEEESQIIYDKKGENIVIDSVQKVSQVVEQETPVFNTLVVPYGKRTQIALADGSKVWLNSGSKLIYPATNPKGKREVYLEGEAIFDVAHSSQNPFFVQTKNFEIKVLGTVFNVSAYPDDNISGAVLEEGKIELGATEKSLFRREKLTILPGNMAIFDAVEKTFRQQQVDTEYYFSWRDGYIICKREPLVNILKKLERYYNVSIELQNDQLGLETFSGNLDMKNSPEEVLNVIAETTPFSLRHENGKLIINLIK
jgi:transmembrane sensor